MAKEIDKKTIEDPVIRMFFINLSRNLIEMVQYRDKSIVVPEEKERDAVDALVDALMDKMLVDESSEFSPETLAKEIVARFGEPGNSDIREV